MRIRAPVVAEQPCARACVRACVHRGESAPTDGAVTGTGAAMRAPPGGVVPMMLGATVNGRPGEDARALPPVALMEDDGY
jgi:hypothetical protein